ncbi:hypothetical protein [Rhizobium leguminosarum]|uniref:hypothetical protein n=1 Tax=Rhizobium leguminosarum TaxID=384 RepID=UPI000FEC89D8|nr:hypothetical protein [Rhizobium leguminosarum]RWX26785.1 hypothetical protein EHI43_27685 [Rhizobium leguminosarum]
MKCSLTKFAAACAIFGFSYPSIPNAEPVTTGIAIYEFYDHFISEGRKWQNKQSWGRMYTWKRGSPVIIGNVTNQVIPFNFEDEAQGCDETEVKLPAMSSQGLRCEDGNAPTEYTIIWKGTHYAAQAQHYYLFEPGQNGEPNLAEVTEEDLKIRLDAAGANVREEAARQKTASANLGGDDLNGIYCRNKLPYVRVSVLNDRTLSASFASTPGATRMRYVLLSRGEIVAWPDSTGSGQYMLYYIRRDGQRIVFGMTGAGLDRSSGMDESVKKLMSGRQGFEGLGGLGYSLSRC